MTLAYDLTVSGVLIIFGILSMVLALELFAPGTILHEVASEGTTLSGAERADFWYQIFVMYIPVACWFLAFAWPLVRAYRRQAITAQIRP